MSDSNINHPDVFQESRYLAGQMKSFSFLLDQSIHRVTVSLVSLSLSPFPPLEDDKSQALSASHERSCCLLESIQPNIRVAWNGSQSSRNSFTKENKKKILKSSISLPTPYSQTVCYETTEPKTEDKKKRGGGEETVASSVWNILCKCTWMYILAQEVGNVFQACADMLLKSLPW